MSADAPVELTGLSAMFQATPLHVALGMQCDVVDDGVRLHGEVGEPGARSAGLPTMHGGAIATLLDSAATFAMLAATSRAWATVDLRIDYLRPVPLGAIEVTGTVVRAGSTVGRARAELRDAAGKVSAVAIGTFISESR